MTNPIGFWFVNDWVDVATLFSTGANITMLAIQTDRQFGGAWIRPGDSADIIRPAKLVDAQNGKRGNYGGMYFEWNIVNLSPMMTNYLRDQLLGSVTAWSSKVTVQTFNRNNGLWEVYNAYARWPDPGADAEAVAGGYNNFKINFVNAQIIT